MRFDVVVVVLCAFASPSLAAQNPNIPAGTSYGKARALMMKQGFEVVKVDRRDDGLARCAPGREEVCDAYPETRLCRGTGRAGCEFMFTRKGKGGGLFSIETQGEDIDPKVVRVRALGDREISGFLAE